MQFEPIHQLRAHEYVAEQIRRHIALRLIVPGEALPSERELASSFGVGRPTIQHAMRLLEADHLVEARRGRYGGTFVEPTEGGALMEDRIARMLRARGELDQLLVYRGELEPRVAGLAAGCRLKDDMTTMRRAMKGMLDAETEPHYMRHDTEFHMAIAAGTKNRFLIAQIEDIRTRLNDAISLLPESDSWHGRIEDEHAAIFAAIQAKNSKAAEAAMDVHVANSEQSLRALLAAAGRRLIS